MASIKTNKGREKMAKAHAGTKTLPAIAFLAVGSGGVDGNQAPKALTGSETVLFNEVKRKAPAQAFPTPYTSRYSIRIDAQADDLVGININEAALIDAEGDIVAYKTFTNKGLEVGTVIDFDYDAEF